MYSLVVLHAIGIFSDAGYLRVLIDKNYVCSIFVFVFVEVILEEDFIVVPHKTCLAKCPPRFQANKGNPGPVS